MNKLHKLDLVKYQKGFNDSYHLRMYKKKEFVNRLAAAIERTNNSYSRGFEKGIIQAEQDLELERAKFDRSPYALDGIKAIRDRQRSLNRDHDLER